MSRPSCTETLRTLYVAAGGGGDAIACAMIARQLEPEVDQPLIASMSWDRLMLDPLPGPRAPSEFIGLEPVGRQNFRVTDATTLTSPAASSLPRLARELPASIYLLDPHAGAPGMARQIAELIAVLQIGAVRLVDVGGDVVARGDEEELRSPLADALSLAAVLAAAPRAEVLVAGLGLDGELPASEVAARCSALEPGAPPFALDGSVRSFQPIFGWHPSEASGLLWAAAMGARGVVEVRDHRQVVALDESSTVVHRVRADGAGRINQVAQAVGAPRSLHGAAAATRDVGATPEIEYEIEKARLRAATAMLNARSDEAVPAASIEELRREAGRRADFITLRAIRERTGLSDVAANVVTDDQPFYPPLLRVRGSPAK